jgi:predicted RNA-binding protein YlxR (DUF448 family)
MRTCVGCRLRSAQDDLLRLQLAPVDEGSRTLEPAMRRRARSGRSAYLCPRRSCLDQAIKRRAFTRAFSSRSGSPAMQGVQPVADTLWTRAIEQVRQEIELLDRSSGSVSRLSSRPESRTANPHTQLRRRGLERLLSELSCSPIPPVRPTPIARHQRSNGQGGTPTHG